MDDAMNMDDMNNMTHFISGMEGNGSIYPISLSFTALQYLHVVFMIFTAAEIIADFLIMYVILRYKFWKVPTYVLILNWTIFDVIRLFTSPVIVIAVLRISPDAIYPYFYINLSINLAFLLGIPITLMVLMLSQIKFFKVHYVKFIVIAWIVVGILCGTYLAVSFFLNATRKESNEALEAVFTVMILLSFIGIIFIAVYVPLLVAVLIICVVYWIMRSYKKNTVAKVKLILVTVYMCYWLTAMLTAAALALCEYYFHFVIPMELLLLYSLMETNALANLYILQVTDKRFKLYLFNLFRCSTNKYEPDMTFETYESVEN